MQNSAPALFQRFPGNQRGRDFAVGDIHGCFSELYRGLEQVGFNPVADRLFGVGDLIDRGKESELFVELLDRPWFHCVRGNHCQMLIDSNDAGWMADWRGNGGGWAMAYTKPEICKWRDAMDTLPVALEVETRGGTVGFIHAGLNGRTWNDVKLELDRLSAAGATRPLCMHMADELLSDVLWDRHEAVLIMSGSGRVDFATALPDFGLKAIICGHTRVPRVAHVGNRWLIDTGAGYNHPGCGLTLLDLDTFESTFITTQ